MGKNDFDKEKLVKYWVDSSDDDFETMIAMYDSKRYNWSLFVGHLLIEKLLKALYAKVNNSFPPFTHNLLKLAEECKLNLTEEQKFFFASVTAFNINTRYDDYKLSFQQKCTPEFTSEWVSKIKSNREWIKKQIM